MPLTSITRIISGGQTGVDRAALDAAMELGLSCGGWCPKGRHAEDGVIPSRYPLQETPTADYAQRTHWNVRDSDGTVILNPRQANYTYYTPPNPRRYLTANTPSQSPGAPSRAVFPWPERAKTGTIPIRRAYSWEWNCVHD